MEAVGSSGGGTSKTVKITDCGETAKKEPVDAEEDEKPAEAKKAE